MLAALVALGSSGCVAKRVLVVGAPSPIESAPEGLAAALPWRLGDLDVRYEISSGTGAPPASASPSELLRRQLRDRLLATLNLQRALGHVDGAAPYILEVRFKGIESHSINGNFVLAVGLQFGVAAVGCVIGALVDLAQPRPNLGEARLTGFLLGGSAGLATGWLPASLVRFGTADGSLQATVVLRRRADRVPVAERHIETTWGLEYDAFGQNRLVERATGDGFVEFEKELLTGLKAMLLEVQGDLATVPP